MIRLRPLRSSFAILAVGGALAILVCFLPQDTYQRWKLLDGTIFPTRWIYERTHFDPTPIDVAIIGPSRSWRGVDAPRLGRELAARGLPAHVVNFSLPKTGRNSNYVIVQQLLRDKQPKLLILGILDRAYQYGHPAFKYIAPTPLVASPNYITNFDYLRDLIYLPYRQLYLFAADVTPGAFGLSKAFDPHRYLGESVDTTADFVRPDGTVVEGARPPSIRELSQGERQWEATVPRPLLGPSTAPEQFGDERHFVQLIAEAARARGVKVMFLFIPGYTGTAKIQDQHFYEQFGPVLNAGFVATHPEWFSNFAHLNRAGAHRLTDWLAERVAASLTPAQASTAVPPSRKMPDAG